MRGKVTALQIPILLAVFLFALSAWASPEAFESIPAVTFSDIPSNHWAYGYIEAINSSGITIGCGSGGYCPSEDVTRDQMVPSPSRASSDGSETNVVPITVNGSDCNSYENEPCVDVTVCTPGTSTCQTISGILLDTASSGLRIFKQVLSVSLTQVTVGSGSLAECIQYADGSSDWGPVKTASVILGNEPAVQVPIQVIDYTFGHVPRTCGTPDQSPSDAGFNGILGVGPFVHDCGSTCVSEAVGQYYTCSGSRCSRIAVPLDSQVQNLVALLPLDNNGVIVQLPGVPAGGAVSVNGSLVLGIGTRPNNLPSGVTTYTLDQYGEFSTTFNSRSYGSFMDTGSNGLFFPSSGLLPGCTGASLGWYCPSTTTNLSATITGASGPPSSAVSFQIGNYDSLINSPNNVFADIGGNGVGQFDWGLPFYFGRNIYMGFEGKGSSLGSGPYFALTKKGTKIDFDGDGKSDIAIYRKSTGAWWIVPSSTGTSYDVGWGGDPSDIPVPGDYDGDGKTDIAIYRKSSGAWWITPSSTGISYGVGWGGDPSDIPVPGDYDGDGKTDIAIYRKSSGAWWITPSSTGTPYGVGSGGDPSDIPVPGDYDGDGKTDIAIYRKSTGAWWITPSSTGTPYGVGSGGDPSDIPLTYLTPIY